MLSLLNIVSSSEYSMRWVTLIQSQTKEVAWTPVNDVFHVFALNRCWLNIVQFNKYLWNVYSIYGTLQGNEGFPTSSIILIKANIQQPKRKLVRKYLFLKIAERRGNTQSKDQVSTSIQDELERLGKKRLQFSGCVCLVSDTNSLGLLLQMTQDRRHFQGNSWIHILASFLWLMFYIKKE